jgi:hypothetical protein
MSVMSKKKTKPTGGKHSTPRKPVQFPVDWLTVAKKVAAKQKMPVVWLMIELVKERAEKLSIEGELPAVPWEDVPPPSKE